MFLVAAGIVTGVSYLLYQFYRRVTVTKEDVNNIDTLHLKLEAEIAKLKQEKRYKLIDRTIDDYCQQIFDIVNENRDKYTIDLHGLFTKQALSFLKDRITQLKKENYSGTLLVITGQGLHSASGGAKIKPMIEEYLTTNNYSFVIGSKGGAYTVSLDKKKINIK
ncbi:small MutS related (smr) family protein [Tieghemostelium lacteum]|uniref:Small MutS related (Smr) family protein n=1 Tax=Tieghemostelium lacteum TaxID=361077 RepID=A0A151ZF21_TIELA|nr:small MutS related (smr) family protein [Tieghemostelium lacteum]|eukprot:KYQ92561.1 small MutS related (smr) family protein [Tieghemostelium lacteum]